MRALFFIIVAVLLGSTANAEVLTGVVIQENGNWAADAMVTISVVHHSPPLRWVVNADDEGRFQIDFAAIENPKMIAVAARWKLQGAEVYREFDKLSASGPQPVTIRLGKGGTLRGRLLREEDGEPVKTARVYMDTGELLVTDEQGEFVIRGLPLGAHSLIPVAPGRVRQYVNFDTANRPDAELELRLPRGTSVTGKITDENGKPIPGAYLTRSSSGTSLILNGWDQTIEPDGTFEYDGIGLKRLFYNIEACAPGYIAAEVSNDIGTQQEQSKLTIRLKKESVAKAANLQRDNIPNDQQEPDANLPRKIVRGFVSEVGGVRLSNGNDHYGADFAASDVAFKFDQIPEGVYDLTISDSNGEIHYSQRIKLKPKEEKVITIKIPETSSSDVFG